MRVTVYVEVELLDDETGLPVSNVTSTTVLEDPDSITTADVANVYEMARQEILDEADKKGRTPTWDYPRKYGKRSKACEALLPKYVRTISTVMRDPSRLLRTGLPADLMDGTTASLAAAQDAL